MRWLFFLSLCACAGSPRDRDASWSYVYQAIVAPNCATSSCHSERAQTASLRFDDPDIAYQALIDRHYVVPGDTSSALLFLLEGDEAPRMPPDAPLPAADIELVRAWITGGAEQ